MVHIEAQKVKVLSANQKNAKYKYELGAPCAPPRDYRASSGCRGPGANGGDAALKVLKGLCAALEAKSTFEGCEVYRASIRIAIKAYLDVLCRSLVRL